MFVWFAGGGFRCSSVLYLFFNFRIYHNVPQCLLCMYICVCVCLSVFALESIPCKVGHFKIEVYDSLKKCFLYLFSSYEGYEGTCYENQ